MQAGIRLRVAWLVALLAVTAACGVLAFAAPARATAPIGAGATADSAAATA